MSVEMITISMFVGVFVGVLLGFPIAFTFTGLAFLFGYFAWGPQVMNLMGSRVAAVMTEFTFVAIPLFVFMGCMLEKSGVATDALGAVNQWLRKVRGGLGIATVILCLVFGACVGVVGASVTTMGLLVLAPMINNGYNKSLATGLVAAGGTLGILLPPSVMLIVFGPMAGVSVVRLFAAAIPPGILLGVCYGIYVGVIGYVKKGQVPEIVKDSEFELKYSLRQGLVAFVPFIFLIFAVLGTIFFGIAAPTEAAGVGALGAIIIAAASRKCSPTALKAAAMQTLRASTMVIYVAVGASLFTGVFFILGGTRVVGRFVAELGLSANALFALVLILVFVLGIFIDWMGVIFIIIPIFMPILVGYGFDPLWVSMVIIVLLQTSFLTPPFAYALFFIRGVAPPSVTIYDIYRGVIPFIIIQLIVTGICLAFPNFITFLPDLIV